VAPQAVIAAWRHVVDVFRGAGATNARWVWVVAQMYPGGEQLPLLWPGTTYVDAVGIDGYFLTRGSTFASVFGDTITTVKGLTSAPILISETGAAPAAGKARVLGALAAGVQHYGLAGFVYFDLDQSGQVTSFHEDWSLDNDPPALAVFTRIAATLPKIR
jgi:hypothetical protein